MTATSPARHVITTCAAWCEGHPADSPLHSRDVPGVWGGPVGPLLGLALEQEDSENGPGKPHVVVQFSHDGVMVDDSQPLSLAAAEDYAVSILRLVALGKAG